MSDTTKIEWTATERDDGTLVPGYTFNPWWGCTKIDPGCAECYAQKFANRVGRDGWGRHGVRFLTSAKNWAKPERWNAEAAADGVNRNVFCASMADVFETWKGQLSHWSAAEVLMWRHRRDDTWGAGVVCDHPHDWRPGLMADARNDLGNLIRRCDRLNWLLLTKRPENAPEMMHYMGIRRLPNVWAGASVSDDETIRRNWPLLMNVMPDVGTGFLSAEPYLGPINFDRVLANGPLPHWVILGVESNGARVGRLGEFLSEMEWISSVAAAVKQLQRLQVPVFVKQIPLDGRVSHDPAEWPEPLRLRHWPKPLDVRPLDLARIF